MRTKTSKRVKIACFAFFLCCKMFLRLNIALIASFTILLTWANFHDFIWSKYSWSSISYTTYKSIITVSCLQRKKKKNYSRYLHELSPFTKGRVTRGSIGQNIHATPRDKKIIENFEQPGISISYHSVIS